MKSLKVTRVDGMRPTIGAKGRRAHKNTCTRIFVALRLSAFGLTFAAWSALACLFVAAPNANAQRISQEYIGASKPFNPSSCKTGDKKYVYWAAKDQVFRFKFDPKMPLYPRGWWEHEIRPPSHWQKEVPPAPMPSEPEGCFGNPLRAGMVPYMQVIDEAEFLKLFGPRPTSGKNSSGRIAPTFSRNENGFLTSSHSISDSLYAESLRKKQMVGKDCWQRSPGILECLISKGTDRNDYTINRYITIENILPPEYAGTSNLYVSIHNDVAFMVNRANGLSAQSRTSLLDVVLLTTDIRIFPNEIDKLKPYHLRLIRYVLDAHVPGYQWTPTTKK